MFSILQYSSFSLETHIPDIYDILAVQENGPKYWKFGINNIKCLYWFLGFSVCIVWNFWIQWAIIIVSKNCKMYNQVPLTFLQKTLNNEEAWNWWKLQRDYGFIQYRIVIYL